MGDGRMLSARAEVLENVFDAKAEETVLFEVEFLVRLPPISEIEARPSALPFPQKADKTHQTSREASRREFKTWQFQQPR
ncbi:MAG TPA: hypothetical protein VE133_12905, partial [Candidatus Sulfotelmatobacter sp.]|nr:hypothetical protein [Candidatus Sulfotelmatobacter sp.]